jgi:hypothetical protein
LQILDSFIATVNCQQVDMPTVNLSFLVEFVGDYDPVVVTAASHGGPAG